MLFLATFALLDRGGSCSDKDEAVVIFMPPSSSYTTSGYTTSGDSTITGRP